MRRRAGEGASSAALVLGAAHATVDGTSAFVLFRHVDVAGVSAAEVAAWIVAYDVLAFALQAPVGAALDRLGRYREATLGGLAAVLLALALAPAAAGPAALVAGVGNALFHAGAGGQVLHRSPGRARAAGLFVGPGAVGLALGILLGHRRSPVAWAFAAALLLCAVALLRVSWEDRDQRQPARPGQPLRRPGIAASLLLATVAARSLAADHLAAAWRHESAVVMALALAACAGKMLGGEAGDRLGWTRAALAALLAAGPLIILGPGHATAALAGMVLLQATMPVTLAGLYRAIPRPGLAFGLASAAVLAGAGPGLAGTRLAAAGPAMLAVVWCSALAVAAGLALTAPPPAGAARPPRAA